MTETLLHRRGATEHGPLAAGLLTLALALLCSASSALAYDCADADVMAARARAAREGHLDEDVIQALTLECDLDICNTPDPATGQTPENVIEGFRRVIDLCAGAPVSQEMLEAGRERLSKTGFFREVTWKASAVPGGWAVTFQMEGALIIRDVTYDGNYPLLESDLQKRLQLVRGRAFAATPRELDAQAQTINELYEQNGYYGTTTRFVGVPVDGDQSLVDVAVKITKGVELAVSRVVIGGHKAKGYQEIRSLLLEPIGWFNRYTRGNISEGIQNLLDDYRKDGYYRVRIVNKEIVECVKLSDGCDEPGTVQIYLELDEGPRWEMEFNGNVQLEDTELREQVTFKESGYVDDVEIEHSKAAIVAAYETAGHYFATVDAEEIEISEGQRRVTFTVVEGPRAEIRAVRLVGNDKLPSEDVLPVLNTQPYGLFQAGVGFLQLPAIKADLNKIVAIYQSRGYLQARVTRWRLEARSGGEDLVIVIYVEEGEATRVGEVGIQRVLPNPALRPRTIPLRDGLTSETIRKGRARRDRADPDGKSHRRPDAERPADGAEPRSTEPPTRSPPSDAAAEPGPVEPVAPAGPVSPEGTPPMTEAAIDSWIVDVTPEIAMATLMKGSLLKPGIPFELGLIAEEQKRLVKIYRDLGYPQAEVLLQCRTERGGWGGCELPSINPECYVPPETTARRTGEQRRKDAFCTESIQDSVIVHSCRPTREDLACLPEGGIQSNAVDVRYLLREGKRMTVGEIFLRGHFRTRPSVIYDELELREGDIFNVARFFKGQSNLRSLGLFDSVSIDTIGVEEDAISVLSSRREATVLVAVEESLSIYIEGTIGVETRNLLELSPSLILTVESALVANNLVGYGKQFQVRGRLAFDVLDLTDAVQLPNTITDLFDDNYWLGQFRRTSKLDYLLGADIILRDPRFFIFRVDASLTSYYNRDFLGAEDPNLDKDEVGVRPEVRKVFPGGWTTLLGFEWKNTATRRRDEDPRTLEGERLFDPRRNTTSISPQLTLDRRDSPLNPTTGFLAEGKVDLAFAVFDSPTEFVRFSVNTAWFKTILHRLTLGVGVRAGWALPFGDTVFIPDDERFKLGGASSLRGFEDNSVGPRDLFFQPLGGELLTEAHAEVRYPLFPNLNLFGASFIDSGLLVDCIRDRPAIDFLENDERIACLDDINLDTIRTTAGLGIRLLVAGQIPVVLDWGILLNRKIGEPVGDLHLDVSYTF